jgi:glycosyltransferase involved in cell wall biosynthesis
MNKKVLHIISSTNWRGGEQQVDYLFNSKSSEYEHYLFCVKDSALSVKNKQNESKIFTYKKRFGFDLFAAFYLKKICLENNIDLIHLHDSHSINSYIIADIMGMNIPAVVHRHVNFSIKSKWKYQHKKIEKIICVSHEVKWQFLSFISEEKLVVVQPGIDIKRFALNYNSSQINLLKKELNIATETKLIGIVSALEKEKNIEEFILIANKISDKRNDIKFIIVGDGSLYDAFKTQHTKHNIIFTGFRNDIPRILSSLDVFLFTSRNEGFGQVILEAMAAKVPVVSSNFPAVKEMIENGKNGFIYNDIDDAVIKMESLLQNDDLRKTTTENAFGFVQQFDISLMNKKVEQIYQQIITNNV